MESCRYTSQMSTFTLVQALMKADPAGWLHLSLHPLPGPPPTSFCILSLNSENLGLSLQPRSTLCLVSFQKCLLFTLTLFCLDSLVKADKRKRGKKKKLIKLQKCLSINVDKLSENTQYDHSLLFKTRLRFTLEDVQKVHKYLRGRRRFLISKL